MQRDKRHTIVVVESGVALPPDWLQPGSDVTVLAEAQESPLDFGARVVARVGRLAATKTLDNLSLFAADAADDARRAARTLMGRALLAAATETLSANVTILATRSDRAQLDLTQLVDSIRPLAKANVRLRLELRARNDATACWRDEAAVPAKS
jgi:hypothetical protein